MPFRLSLIAAVLLLTAAACSGPRDTEPAGAASAVPEASSAEAAEPEIVLDEPFTLRVGETALFAEDSARVRFDAVESDGRCPLDVTCVWAGEATAQFTLLPAEGPAQPFALTIPGLIHGEPADLERYQLGMAGPYAFALLLLEPYPGSEGEDDAPPTATLLMRRLTR